MFGMWYVNALNVALHQLIFILLQVFASWAGWYYLLLGWVLAIGAILLNIQNRTWQILAGSLQTACLLVLLGILKWG
jgi:hypothetical protein